MYRIKRFLDLVFSVILMTILSPLLLLISILVKTTSRGPILFKQKRLGKHGNPFVIYKFRTMIKNAEKIGAGIFISDNDKRITKIGYLLRITSLDELPQLFNIIRGEMSFVGPRPPVPYHPYKYEDYNDEQKIRFSVLPGITGYAQVLGRNSLNWDERIKLDVEYVKNRNIFLDIKIIYLTFLCVLMKENIYSGKD
ncbi:sugar transferase [Clostridium sp. D2Q-11]|uniref:Sugar transferase n=1 Tax=Anaeromonas frigoriresistens TaxID=2683708 RepID=A0A942UWH5_9FIRM|nr:sugar transferase [Anaeromonas frigoriresistens]MBS4538825.1 sugar transferase [Anaeromonas frigoriresistens]